MLFSVDDLISLGAEKGVSENFATRGVGLVSSTRLSIWDKLALTEVVCKTEEDVAGGSSRGVLRDCNARMLSLNEDFQ